jgi:hypothetical protein
MWQIDDIHENNHIIEFALKPNKEKTVVRLTINSAIKDIVYGQMNFYWITTLA